MKKLFIVLFVLTGLAMQAANLVLVEKGKPKAAIVTADKPAPGAEYAALELAAYIKKATGAQLPVVKESAVSGEQTRIYVGATKAAELAGLGQNGFDKEAYVIKVVGGNLYIVGGENDKPLFYEQDPGRARKENYRIAWDNGIVRDTRRGTLYGVYAFLDRFLGIRWLWPGELGTYIPESENLAVKETLEINGAPPVKYRKYRIAHVTTPFFCGSRKSKELDKLSFSEGGLKNYCEALRKYLLIYQEGDSEPVPEPASHITSWWKRYGKEHPGWFAMRDDGKRAPYAGDHNYIRLCVSEPGLAGFIVEENWNGGGWIGLGEADTRGFCRCEKCMAWDQPQPSGFKGYSTTNRYIRYAQKVRELAMKRNRDVKISILMYMDYIMPPTGNPDLSWMYGKFVPWGSGVDCWYPMKESSAREIMDIWNGWRKTGIKINYRPNYLLSGYVIPALELAQSGEMLQFAGANGMMGFDYDSLLGYWATKGPMLYMHMRLGTDPSLSIDKINEEYYAAFGPAAEDVRKYFDYWIEYTRKLPHGGVEYRNAQQAAEFYPPEVFSEPEKILSRALNKAVESPRPEFAERVRFLRNGLKHGKLAAEFSLLFQRNEFSAASRKLDELIVFRRAHENDFIADYCAAQMAEEGGYKGLSDFMQGKFKNFSDPPLVYGKFQKDSVEKLEGLRPGKWGLTLPKKVPGGSVVFKYDAGTGNQFAEADLSIETRADRIGNTLEISFDGENYRQIESDLRQKKISLSSLVKDKEIFFLRFTAKRKIEPGENEMALIRFRMDYAKKYPEKQKVRPKLEIGSGWIDFKSDWFFKKDIGNTGLPAAEMQVETFSSKGWTTVDVPARLERTAVGPYLGYGWYAAEFTVPKDWAARSVDFLFEAVDEQAWVYLNGKYIGEHSVGSEGVDTGTLWNEPFIVKAAADHIRAGGKNLLIVKTHAAKGAHGIWKPVKIRPVDASAQ